MAEAVFPSEGGGWGGDYRVRGPIYGASAPSRGQMRYHSLLPHLVQTAFFFLENNNQIS